MALTISCIKNPDNQFDIGYGAFDFNLRMSLLEFLDKRYKDLYMQLVLPSYAKDKDFLFDEKAINELLDIYEKRLIKMGTPKEFFDFVYASDCSGKAPYVVAKYINTLITKKPKIKIRKDIKESLIELFKDCEKYHCGFEWY